jgi:hypothetical protein
VLCHDIPSTHIFDIRAKMGIVLLRSWQPIRQRMQLRTLHLHVIIKKASLYSREQAQDEHQTVHSSLRQMSATIGA